MFADLAIYNGQIVSMDQRHSHHEAMAVKHGRIVGMGAWQDITPFIDKQTQVINWKAEQCFLALSTPINI